MGSLLSAISGLAGGLADKYSEIQDEKRQESYKNQQVVRKALEDQYQLEEDPKSRAILRDQMIGMSGYDKKTAEQLKQTLGGLDSLHEQKMAQQKGARPQLEMDPSGEGPTGQSFDAQKAFDSMPQAKSLSPVQRRAQQLQDIANSAKKEQIGLQNEGKENVADTQASGRVTSADIQAQGRQGVANTSAASREAIAAGKNITAKEIEEIRLGRVKKGGLVIDESSPTGYSYAITDSAGNLIPEKFVKGAPQPRGLVEHQSVRQQIVEDPITHEKTLVDIHSSNKPVLPDRTTPPAANPSGAALLGTSGYPPEPPTNAQARAQAATPSTPLPSAPAPAQAAPRPLFPSSIDPAEISALADMAQNDFATYEKLLKQQPKPIQAAAAKEVRRREVAGEGVKPVFLGTQVRNQALNANEMLPVFPRVNAQIDALDKAGKLGPIAGRWQDFLAGRVGAGDPEYAALASDISLLKGKVSQIHFGSNAGVQAVQRFDKILGADKMDAPQLKASLGSLFKILSIYGSRLPEDQKEQLKATPSTPIPQKDGEKKAEGGYEVGATYGGLQYLGGPIKDQANWKKVR